MLLLLIVRCLILLSLDSCWDASNTAVAAPPRHLIIGVQGNTPTLMVTSAEVNNAIATTNSTHNRSDGQQMQQWQPQQKSLQYAYSNTVSHLTIKDKADTTTNGPQNNLITDTQLLLIQQIPQSSTTKTPMNDTKASNYPNNGSIILEIDAANESLKHNHESIKSSVKPIPDGGSLSREKPAKVTDSTEAVLLLPASVTSDVPASTKDTITWTPRSSPIAIVTEVNWKPIASTVKTASDASNRFTAVTSSAPIITTVPTSTIGAIKSKVSKVPTFPNKTFHPLRSGNAAIESLPATKHSILIPAADIGTQAPIAFNKDTVVQLIDLEKHDLNSLQHVQLDNSGHDGYKITKKKQLIDKHFLEDMQSTKQPMLPIVKHGYLGPLFMAEKRFHTVKSLAKHLSHESSIASQLRNGRIVEIKPPHQPTANTAVKNSRLTAGNAMPTISSPDHAYTSSTPSILFSTTMFQVDESGSTSIPQMPANTTFTLLGQQKNETSAIVKTESKISDIQIEVYDSTIDSLRTSANFKETMTSTTLGSTTKPPTSQIQQERFTQYVIDRIESSTPHALNTSLVHVISGIPEPAAIEIHINVSESLGNEIKDDEEDFSFPQNEFINSNVEEFVGSDIDDLEDAKSNEIKLKLTSNILTNEIETTDQQIKNKSLTKEILLENHKNGDSDMINSEGMRIKSPESGDQTFSKHNYDRDSDTIFYISNTEVKVGESVPTGKPFYEEQLHQELKAKLENQFFPANYVASTRSPLYSNDVDNYPLHHVYEEDIILSRNQNQADALKIYRNNEPAPPLDVTYVGESIMEVEQSPESALTTTLIPEHAVANQLSGVIIQPVSLPANSMGATIIDELSPQIRYKEIDFMPNDEPTQQQIIMQNEQQNENAGSNNKNQASEKLFESSIQYGGDLIDESADGGFDGVENSYPFANPAYMGYQPKHTADYSHVSINYAVNNMRRDELSADLPEAGYDDTSFNALEVDTTKINSNGSAINADRLENATLFPKIDDDSRFLARDAEIVNFLTILIGLLIIILPLVVGVAMFCALRYLYSKYQTGAMEESSTTETKDCSHNASPKDESISKQAFVQQRLSKDIQADCRNSFNKPSNATALPLFPENIPPSIDCQSPRIRYPYESTDCQIYFPLTHRANANTNAFSSVQADCPYQYQYHYHNNKCNRGTNGSVTTMTLENNLLIVETEERNDISRMARETKMDYNKEGVFVVEVARGIDSKSIPSSPIGNGNERLLSMFETKKRDPNKANAASKAAKGILLQNNDGNVQVHSPPTENEDSIGNLEQIDEVEEPILTNQTPLDENSLAKRPKTGLSQSNSSLTSSNDSNKDYMYGNQKLYIIENNDYVGTHLKPLAMELSNNKDAKDDDQKSQNGHNLKNTFSRTQDTETIAEQDMENDSNNQNSAIKSNEKKQCTQNAREDNTIQGNSENDLHETQINNPTLQNSEERKEDSKPIYNPHNASDATMAIVENLPDLIPDNKLNETENETENENDCESIISLPEPPTDMEVLCNNNNLIESTNPMTASPPPPPPLQYSALEQQQQMTNDETIKSTNHLNIVFNNHHNNGNNNNNNNSDKDNENNKTTNICENKLTLASAPAPTQRSATASLPPPSSPSPSPAASLSSSSNNTELEFASNGNLVAAPLTPPASPVIPYSNGLHHGALYAARAVVAVDVNGS